MIKIKVAQAKKNLKFNVGLGEDEAPCFVVVMVNCQNQKEMHLSFAPATFND